MTEQTTTTQTLSLDNDLEELPKLHAAIEQFFQRLLLNSELAGEMQLVAEELLVNTIEYGYKDQKKHRITIDLSHQNQLFSLTLIDDAMAFNPLEVSPPELGLAIEDCAVGGLGLPLIKALSDSQHYRYENEQNIVTINKSTAPSSAG